MIRVLCFSFFLAPVVSQAQFTYLLDASIPVQQSAGDPLALAWAGGLNAAHFNTMDLDGNGTDDLVLFDRMANKVITFISSENGYVSAPEYENFFPDDITNWLLLRDYNCDGRKDIFTGDVLGIKVYKNVTPEGGDPQWEPHLFNTGFSGLKSKVVLTQGNTDKVNLQLQYDDVPSIGDVDGDGDLDILNFQYSGSTVEFHRNLTVENNWSCDSLEFKRITRTWGNFRDCGCGNFAFNSADCPPNSGGRPRHAGGKSLLAVDLNGDAQQDLLFSEAECTGLYSLVNQGTNEAPVINAASPFPQSSPANFAIFPTAFYEDVDFDGNKDLIVTPNIFSKEYLNTDLRRSTWFYKNTGTTSQPLFTLAERDFLQRQMIDVGDNAVPAFIDFDGDNDLDMFISNHSAEDYSSAVYLYENTGTSAAPSFRLENDDYFGFSGSRFFNLKIQFADVDSDQTTDLVFTATSFDNYLTNLYYLPNKSQTVLDFSSSSLHALGFDLTSTENVYLVDINGDGLADLLAGRSEGNLEYWKNDGIPGAPSFALEQSDFLGFGSSTLRQNPACSVADLDADGNADLVVGDQTGILRVISDFRNAAANSGDGESNIIFNARSGVYSPKNLGGGIWPTVANLFNTNKPSIVVGNVLGGIHLLRHDGETSLPEDPEMSIYPNPVLKTDELNIVADRAGSMEVFSVVGQKLTPPVIIKANQVHRYTLPSLAAGVYLLKFTSGNKSRTRRLVVR